MARASTSREPSWLVTLLGVIVLVVAGFLLGLVAGVVSEEPELVAGHLAGRSESVDWTAEPAEEADRLALGEVVDLEGPPVGDLPPAVKVEPQRVAAVAVTRGEATPAPVSSPSVELPSVAAAPPPRALPPPPGPAVSFSVQVGAFGTSRTAEGLASDLRGKGYPVEIVPTLGEKSGRWRVRVGPLPTKSEADVMARRLQAEEQLPTWVLREGEG